MLADAQKLVRNNAGPARLTAAVLGVISGLFCIMFLLLTLFHALGLVMPAWAAALCVAVALAILAGVMVMAGAKRFKTINAAAPKTVASLKENVEWAKRQVK